ncbi:MAG: hypothetical protein AAF412_04580 [Pseudomonadota bacterium]
MDNENKVDDSANDTAFSEELSAEEQAYFDNEGAEPEKEEDKPAEEAATKEPTAEEVEEPEAEQKQSMVPHGALHQEREERKKVQAEMARMQDRFDRLTEAMITNQPQKEAQETEEIPDRKEDPLGYMGYQDQRLAALEQQINQQSEQTQYANQVQSVVNHVSAQLQEDGAADPAIASAYDHVFGVLKEQAKDQGYSEQDAIAVAHDQERDYAIQIAKMGVRPGAFIKMIAEQNGWSPEAPKSEDNGETVADKINRDGENADRHKTLSSAEGAAPKTTADVLSMSDDEFGAWLDKVGEDGWRKEVM